MTLPSVLEHLLSSAWVLYPSSTHRCVGRDRDFGNHGVSSQVARAVGCHRKRHKRTVIAGGGEELGQSTVEFAIVTAGFLSIVVAFGLLWKALDDGLFVGHALSSASHHVQEAMPGSTTDVLLY